MPQPSSNNNAKLSVMPIAPAVQPFDALSAIGKLQFLSKNGTLDTAEVASLLNGVQAKEARAKAAVADDLTDRSRSEMEIRPVQQQYNLEALSADRELIRPRADATRTALTLSTGQNQGAIDRLQASNALADATIRAQSAAVNDLLDWGDAFPAKQYWEKNGLGALPKKNGVPDREAVVSGVAQHQLVDGFSKSSQQQQLFEAAEKKGPAGLSIMQEVLKNPTTENVAAAHVKISELPDVATAGETKGAEAAVGTAIGEENDDAWVDSALGLVGNKNIAPVGPLAGSAVGRFQAWLKAMSGSAEKYNAQSVLRQGLNRQVLKAGTLLKGSTSNRDLDFLKASVPQLTDTPEVWTDYLAQLKAALARGREYRRQAGGFTPTGRVSEGAPAAPDVQTDAARVIKNFDKSKLPSSREEAIRLKIPRYVREDGTVMQISQ